MALTDKYSLPVIKGLGDADSVFFGDSYSLRHGATVDLLVGVVSPYKTCQLQWQSRRRYKPSYVAQHSTLDQTASEVWTNEWSDTWHGDGIDSGQTYRFFTGDELLYKSVTLATVTDDYDTGDYDAIEYRVRLRIYNSGDGAFSEWVECDLLMVYLPHVTSATFEASADGSAVTFESNATRPYTAYMTRAGDRAGADQYRLSFTPDNSTYTNRFLAPLDADRIEFDLARSYGCTFADSLVSDGKAVVTRGTAPSTVANPIISYTYGSRLGVSVRAVTGVYSDVDVCAKWTAADGTERFVTVQADYSAPFWKASLEVPFDTPVTLVYKVVSGSRYKIVTETQTLDGQGKLWLTDGDVEVSLSYDLDETSPFTMDADEIKPAGRNRPIVRYGEGGRRERTIDCTIEAKDARILHQLQEPHDWTLRAYGDMCRVSVRAITPTRKQGLGRKLISLAINVLEVE